MIIAAQHCDLINMGQDANCMDLWALVQIDV